LLAESSVDSALIVVRGDHIVVDLNGASLEGNSGDPDQAAGVAIRVDSGTDITIKNGSIHGYRVNILARGTRNITFAALDLSRSWKPRLYSLIEHESLADWLSFHHNENREWLRFGAAVYLEGVSGGEISGVTAEQGMNGLMLVRTDSLRVHHNTIQFNSGLGIGMYRSSWNWLYNNRLDFNVRGYSNGFYWRGQDSADLLMFEQSSNNLVDFNSATHGGDGLFLWAGQSTMDSGEGGATDNIFSGNDFSYAPANAMEATFSRNTFFGNRANGSDYGLWGGYSYDSHVVGNCFTGNRIGVAIEHGQSNDIKLNTFDRNVTAIRLWGDKLEPSDWGYPKHKNTDSRMAAITANNILHTRTGVSVADTRGLTLLYNAFVQVDTPMVFKDTAAVRVDSNFISQPGRTETDDQCPIALPDVHAAGSPASAMKPAVPSSPLSLRDRSAMIITEWGPYDYRTPLLWPVDSTHANPLRLAVLGPPGGWSVAAKRGIAALSSTSGPVGDTITVFPDSSSSGDWRLTLISNGRHFTYTMFEPKQHWTVNFYTWSDTASMFAGKAVLTAYDSRLDYEWYKPRMKELPQEKWSLDATSTVDLPPGDYTLRTISDDGIRVWIDGRLAIDDWQSHESAVDAVRMPAGKHELHVEYYQSNGWTELRLEILQGFQTAGGSPGPH
jgi:parallel beta-helix repeat protein